MNCDCWTTHVVCGFAGSSEVIGDQQGDNEHPPAPPPAIPAWPGEEHDNDNDNAEVAPVVQDHNYAGLEMDFCI
jgi:hypothetical protein